MYSSSAQLEGFRTAHFVAIEGVDRVADLFEQVGGDDGYLARVVEAEVG